MGTIEGVFGSRCQFDVTAGGSLPRAADWRKETKAEPGSRTNGPKRDRPSCAMGQFYWPQGVGWWVFGR